jgi:hypothetical protein
MNKKQLFEEDSTQANPLKINRKFEKRYLHNKKRVELEKLEAKHAKNQGDPSDSEDLISEDSDGDLLRDDDLVIDFLTTYSKIKNKDNDIYNDKNTFYRTKEKHLKGEINIKKNKTENIEEPRNLKKLFLERMGKEDVEEEENVGETPVAVQERLKKEFQSALNDDKGMLMSLINC